ncbi:hypothetical protein OJAV_G00225020 [Oryzias javanicus]|uniref:GRIP domain-containing protein n=1 Tax=Oryzias javanicus TaxID=123683 RepID=A0A3S2NQC7_ORYJA|nr:hypothetical protein OJAV_G00225020 [Oryzias javanicus]
MDKFGMSFGGGPSRKELLDTIESQKKQLVQYQTRFKDVVRAYKSLLKEKEALEASLKVLSVGQEADQNLQPRPAGPDFLEDGSSVHSEDSVDKPAPADGGSEEEPGESGPASTQDGGEAERQRATPPLEPERRPSQLRGQLSTLTAALATVTQEKSRMEASFQADKRQLKQEVEELQERLAAAAAQQEAELHDLQQQLAESRARVITQQHEREREQGDHAQQLRELQKLLQLERAQRQDAELRLQDAGAALLASSQAADRGAECQLHLSQVREQRDELQRRLRGVEEEQKKPHPRVEELQQEVQELKARFQQQVLAETRKAAEAEERAAERAAAAERRAAGLELRVSELSDLLGSCEAARQRDQHAAQRLRDRILQLDTENKTLALAASGRAGADLRPDDTALDVDTLRDKLQTIKKLLALAAQKNPDQNLQDPPEPGESPAAAACQLELRQLKEEFERYKQRAQVVLKNKNAKDGCHAQELQEARAQLAELREKYISLRIQSDDAGARHGRQLEERQQALAALQQAHRQELERAEALHRDQRLCLEAELHKHRKRATALLDEKDRELERLRAAALGWPESHEGGAAEAEASSDGEGDAVSQALRRATPTESTLLLYAQQLARVEVEAGALRRQKHQLEEDLHQLQAKLIANAERHDEDAARLRAQLDKLARDQSREGANLEYLKNVTYKFLTLPDGGGRQQTLGAILTILHFSPQERSDVLKRQGGAWWGPALK